MRCFSAGSILSASGVKCHYFTAFVVEIIFTLPSSIDLTSLSPSVSKTLYFRAPVCIAMNLPHDQCDTR